MAVEQIDLTQDDSDSGAEPGEFVLGLNSSVGGLINTPSRQRSVIDLESQASRNPSPPPTQTSSSRAPISPPALRRSAANILIDQCGLPPTLLNNPAFPSTEPVTTSPQPPQPQPPQKDVKQHVPEMARLSSLPSRPSPVAPRSPTLPPKARSVSKATTPKSQTSVKLNTDVPKLIASLETFRTDIKKDHVQLVTYIIDSVEPPDYRCKSGPDLFANVKSKPADEADENEAETMRLKFRVC